MTSWAVACHVLAQQGSGGMDGVGPRGLWYGGAPEFWGGIRKVRNPLADQVGLCD